MLSEEYSNGQAVEIVSHVACASVGKIAQYRPARLQRFMLGGFSEHICVTAPFLRNIFFIMNT